MKPPHPREVLALAREFLDERRCARELSEASRLETDRIFGPSESIARRLLELTGGRAILVDDRVLVPTRTARGTRLYAFEVWDLDLEGVDIPSLSLNPELARFAGRMIDAEAEGSIRRASLCRRAREATGCSAAESWEIVSDMERVGFEGDAIEFNEMACAILERNRARDAEPDPTPSDQYPRVADVLDHRD